MSSYYKRDERRKPVEFSLNQFLLMAVCFVVLLGLTVVCMSGPLLQRIDEWGDKIENQVKTLYVLMFVGIIITGKWFLEKLRG